MRCPFCRSEDTRVIDSREADGGNAVRRRRECGECGERFSTVETASLRIPSIVKSDGRRASFNEDKLRSGMQRALEKRPVKAEAIDESMHRIIRKMMTVAEREIQSRQIGEWVMEELEKLDQVAYVRFASVYRSFQDVDEFNEEITRLQNQPESEQTSLESSSNPESGNKSS